MLFYKRLATLVAEQKAPELAIGISGRTAVAVQPRRGHNEMIPEYKVIIQADGAQYAGAKVVDKVVHKGSAAKVSGIDDS